MEYYLESQLINSTPKIELTEETFNKIKTAQDILGAAFDIEDKYDLIISAYIDLEKDILGLTAANLVRFSASTSYENFHEMRTLVNRRLITILTAARLYLERLPISAALCSGNQVTKDVINSLKSREYDDHLEFRFIEALRNSVQHSNLPVHSVSYGMKRVDHTTHNDAFQYKSSFVANKSEFAKDKNFKTTTYNELPEKIDLLHYVRVYLSCLNSIHIKSRALIEEPVIDARTTIEDQEFLYCGVNNGNALALHAVKKEDSEIVESIMISSDWDDIRLSLLKKNKELQNLQNRFIRS